MYPSPYEKRIEKEDKWMFRVFLIIMTLSIFFLCYKITNAKSWSDLKIEVVPIVVCGDNILPEGMRFFGCYNEKTTTITMVQGYTTEELVHELGHFITINTKTNTIKKIFNLPRNTSWADIQEYAANRYVDYIFRTATLSQFEIDFYKQQVNLIK